MAKLPSVLDYGKRPSLHSNRLDMPGNEAAIIGEGVANAAGVVVGLLQEKQQRDNRLEFALAKDELTKADILEREALKDRQDHDAYDEDYTQGYQGRADGILANYKLTASDRALLSAESNLIRERGRVYAGDMARVQRLDNSRAYIEQALIEGIGEIEVAAPELQNEIMKNKLEMVRGAIDEGAYTEEQGVAMLQAFVTEASTASLGAMDPEQRLAEVELAIAHREARGHMTRDEILAGEGSGSIGDYLPLHELRKMQEATETEIEIDQTQELGNQASDEAWALYGADGQTKERDAYIRENYEGDARKEALFVSARRLASNQTGDGLKRAGKMQTLLDAIDGSQGGIQLEPGMLSELSATERAHVENRNKRKAAGHEWAPSTSWAAREEWDNLSQQEKEAVNFDGTFVLKDGAGNPVLDEQGRITNVPWKSVVDLERAEYMSADRGEAKNGKRVGGDYDGRNQNQVLEDALIQTPFFDKKPGAGKDEQEARERWARISDNFNRALIAADRSGVTVDSEKRLEILGRVLMHEVYTPEGMPDERRLFAGLDPATYKEAYIPIGETVILAGRQRTIAQPIPVPVRYGGGTADSAFVWIKNTMTSLQQEEPSQRDIEEAWFYLVTQGWDAAYARMSGAEGY